jgi:hypothetical protein
MPAWSAARRDVLPALSGSARASQRRRWGYGTGDVLVVLQVGLAMVFVLSAAMLIRVAGELERQMRPAVQGDVRVARLVTRGDLDRADRSAVYTSVLESVMGAGGLAQAALASAVPAVSGPQSSIDVAASGGPSGCRATVVHVIRSYFETLGVRLERGAVPRSGVAAIVSASAARRCWTDTAQEWKVRLDGWLPVAGVAPDLASGPAPGRARFRTGDPATVWIVGPAEWQGQVFLLVRPMTTVSSESIADAVSRASAAVAMEPLAPLADASQGQARQMSFMLGLLVVVGLMALALAFVGVYAALSQSSAQRQREFGVRLALGAGPSRLVRAAVAREAPLVAAGIMMGGVGTLWVTGIVWRDLLLLSGTDPRVWMVVCGLLGAAATIASLGPVMRAVRVDPVAVLRSE